MGNLPNIFQGLSRRAKKIQDFPGFYQDVATLDTFQIISRTFQDSKKSRTFQDVVNLNMFKMHSYSNNCSKIAK